MKILAAALALLSATSAAAADFDPREWHGKVAEPTEILVLGTTHLSGLADSFQPDWLAPLIDRLAAFKPDVITVEGLSSEECQHLTLYAAVYPGVANDYCSRFKAMTAVAGPAMGLAPPAAEAAARDALVHWPASPTPADRRRLAALFAAAGDPASALVQWLRLPAAERRAGDGITAPLADMLVTISTFHNENYLIGAALAARLGLERVCACDDHTSDRITAEAPPGYDDVLKSVWSGDRPPLAQQAANMEKALDGPASVLALYRFMNRPDVLRQYVEADFGRALVEPSAQHQGRRYVAWWETRNLRMIANIRAASGNHPGGRVLTIVGASHKPYFDAYLAMMSDMKLVDAAAFLAR